MADKKKSAVKKVREEKYRSEEQQEIIRFIKILIIVIIFILAIYFVTRIFVKKDMLNSEKETAVTTINYNKIVFGTMLNRPYDEYYAFAFSSEDNRANYYSALAEKYSKEKNSLRIFYIDLEDSMNKDFIASDGKSNPDAKTVNDLKVKDITLIKVKDGKIAKYFENIEDIERELSIN